MGRHGWMSNALPIPMAPVDASRPATATADVALARQEFLAAASASDPLARAVFVRLVAALAAQEPRGEAFRRVVLGDDPSEGEGANSRAPRGGPGGGTPWNRSTTK